MAARTNRTKTRVGLGLVLAGLVGCTSGAPSGDGSGGRSGGGGSGGGSNGSGGSVGSGGAGGRGGASGLPDAGGSGGRDASAFDAPDADVMRDAPLAAELPADVTADAPTDGADAPADAPAADRPADAADAPGADAPELRDVNIPDGRFDYPNPDGRLCGSSRHTLGKTAAEIVIVLDRSGSMDELTTPPRTRWDDARDAVYDAVLANQNFAWGLKLLPTMGGVTCKLDPGVEVPVAFGNGPALQAAIDPAGPPFGSLGNGTPTAAAVTAAATYLKTVTTSLPKYLLLATDGAPTCGSDTNASMRDDARAIAAIQDAALAGFKTYVIGIATDPDDVDTLNRMTDAGGTARAGATRYYPAGNRADLDAAIQAIGRAVTTCVFPLVTRPPNPEFVGVTAGGSLVPRDPTHVEGWDYTMSGTAIEIKGTACDDLKLGKVLNVDVHLGC